MNEYQKSLARAVGDAWRAVAEGRKRDRAEFKEEGRKRDVERRRAFVGALKTARRAGVPWSGMEKEGVSKPTLYKYGKGEWEDD